MPKPSNFEFSRRNLLLGTATSMALAAVSKQAYAQGSPDSALRAPALALEAPSLGHVVVVVSDRKRRVRPLT